MELQELIESCAGLTLKRTIEKCLNYIKQVNGENKPVVVKRYLDDDDIYQKIIISTHVLRFDENIEYSIYSPLLAEVAGYVFACKHSSQYNIARIELIKDEIYLRSMAEDSDGEGGISAYDLRIIVSKVPHGTTIKTKNYEKLWVGYSVLTEPDNVVKLEDHRFNEITIGCDDYSDRDGWSGGDDEW